MDTGFRRQHGAHLLPPCQSLSHVRLNGPLFTLSLSQAETIYHLAETVPGAWGSVTCLSPLIELFWSLGTHLESRKRPQRESELFISTHRGQAWGWDTCLSSSHRSAVSLDKTRASCTGNGSRPERSGSASPYWDWHLK